jgi:hypothetical protein
VSETPAVAGGMTSWNPDLAPAGNEPMQVVPLNDA